MLLGIVLPTFAVDQAELDERIRKLTARFESMQDKPDKKIPAEELRKAQGIVLLERTKAGFIFAFEGGGGLAMVRDPKSQKWSAPAFLDANEASLGFQVGGQQSFIVILLMTTNSTRLLTHGDIELGGEARGTAGNSSVGEEGKAGSQPNIRVYDDRQGLYGGAALKGGALSGNDVANNTYYKQHAPLEDILFKNKFKPSEPATKLIEKINQSAK
jgi:lipid-binding SYLF domain-containing protein